MTSVTVVRRALKISANVAWFSGTQYSPLRSRTFSQQAAEARFDRMDGVAIGGLMRLCHRRAIETRREPPHIGVGLEQLAECRRRHA